MWLTGYMCGAPCILERELGRFLNYDHMLDGGTRHTKGRWIILAQNARHLRRSISGTWEFKLPWHLWYFHFPPIVVPVQSKPFNRRTRQSRIE